MTSVLQILSKFQLLETKWPASFLISRVRLLGSHKIQTHILMWLSFFLFLLLGIALGQITVPVPITSPLVTTTIQVPSTVSSITGIPSTTPFEGPRKVVSAIFSTRRFYPFYAPNNVIFEIKVGVAVGDTLLQQNIGFSVCGGAIPLSLEYLRKQGYLNNVDFQLDFYRFPQ